MASHYRRQYDDLEWYGVPTDATRAHSAFPLCSGDSAGFIDETCHPDRDQPSNGGSSGAKPAISQGNDGIGVKHQQKLTEKSAKGITIAITLICLLP
jgi:hypothetical protein